MCVPLSSKNALSFVHSSCYNTVVTSALLSACATLSCVVSCISYFKVFFKQNILKIKFCLSVCLISYYLFFSLAYCSLLASHCVCVASCISYVLYIRTLKINFCLSIISYYLFIFVFFDDQMRLAAATSKSTEEISRLASPPVMALSCSPRMGRL